MLEYGWYPLLLFIVTPWFLHRLGTEQYGHWMLLTATVGFGGVLNTGTGAATIKAISAGTDRNETGDADRTIKASLAIALLGGGVLALFVFSGFWLASESWLSRMGDPVLVRQTGVVAAALILLEQLDNVFSSAMKGAEHFSHAAQIEVASKTVQVLAAAIIVLDWPYLSAVYVALVMVAVLRLVAKAVITRQLLGLSDLRPSFAGTAEILHFAKWGWMQGVGGVLFSVADRMVVGSLLGATSLTYYSIASQLAMQIHAVTAAGVSVIFPKVSRKLSNDRQFSLWRVTKLSMAGNLLLSTCLALVLILFGPTILQVWIGTDTAAPTAQILPWLAAAYWVLSLNIVPYYILLGMGRIRIVGLTVLASSAVAVIAMSLAISWLGLIGAPIGRGIYAILTLALIFPLARHFIQERNARIMEKSVIVASGSEPPP